MKQKNIKTVVAFTLILCLVLSMSSVAFAQERMIVTTTSSFVRNSNTKGTATLTADSSNPDTPYMKSKMTLQEAPLGSSKYTNSNVDPQTKTTTRSIIMHTATFPITTTKEYRVKMEVTDNTNGLDNTLVFYEYLE